MITILGLGNILLQDEGFGVHFVRWFQERHDLGPDVKIADGGTLGFLLLDLVCESDHLLVIDAVQVDEKPGTLFRFTSADLPPAYLSQGAAHDAAFLQVLLQAEMLDQHPEECVIIGVVPGNMKRLGLSMTPAIEETFFKVEEQVLKELARWGVAGGEERTANF